MSGHSPGPWEMAEEWMVRKRASWERARLIYDAESKLVAVVPEYPGFSSPDERAALIAAAPELLRVLRGLLRDGHASDCFCAACEEARALVARIESP